ncbi:MAG: hypothetical protein IAE79_17900 [Anaerolinea sp.]|nr:hypothetical protein [Anaerolinea sp.]
MNKLSPDYEVLPVYGFVCCSCGHEQAARPSLMMQFGENSGAGTCLACGEFLHLSIDEDAGIMVAEAWDSWLEKEETAVTEA